VIQRVFRGLVRKKEREEAQRNGVELGAGRKLRGRNSSDSEESSGCEEGTSDNESDGY
jgi:hypothetical protein